MGVTLPKPFRIMDCALTILSLGRSAQTLRELRDHLQVVPVQSLTHHFYDGLLTPAFDDPEYRNDFAIWARRQLHDDHLAERLGVIDPMEFADLEELRLHLLDVIEDHLAEAVVAPQSARGKEFHFCRSQFVVLDTRAAAETPEELAVMVPNLSTGSIFYHFIEARRREPLRVDDFSAWLESWGPDYWPVRDQLAVVDFQQWTLTEVRERVARSFDGVWQGREKQAGEKR
jgi:hypothetical protein